MREAIDLALKNRQDDLLFATFARDLARRHRRPGLYPRVPSLMSDALEQLCGGGTIAIPTSTPVLPDDLSISNFDD